MTLARAIGSLRPFPALNALRAKWPIELITWFNELRYQVGADGLRVTEAIRGTTTTATPKILWAYEIPKNSAMLVTAAVIGRSSVNICAFTVKKVFEKLTGLSHARVMNGEPIQYYESSSGTDVSLDIVTSGYANLQVTGLADTTFTWQGYVEYTVLRI